MFNPDKLKIVDFTQSVLPPAKARGTSVYCKGIEQRNLIEKTLSEGVISDVIRLQGTDADRNKTALLETKSKEFANARENGVYIFGAKRLGEVVFKGMQVLGFKVWGFVDNDKTLWGEDVQGCPVYDPSVLKEAKATICIASTVYTHTLINQVKGMGSNNLIQYSFLSLFSEEWFPTEIPYRNIFEDFSENAPRYLELYPMLADEKSRRVLTGLLKYRLTYEPNYVAEISDPAESQYFDDELVTYGTEEVFIDVGAYDGDTSQNYHELSGGVYKNIYLLEPDEALLAKAKERPFADERTCFIAAGAYSHNGEVSFDATGVTDGAITPLGSQKVAVVSLDSLDEITPTFIKMDIEGAEPEAIRGSQNLIAQHKPMLAIAVYHFGEDIWKILDQVRSINSAYKFYLRH